MLKNISIFLFCSIILGIFSCSDNKNKGDYYYSMATAAINCDSIIKAYSFLEKATKEFHKDGSISKENRARILKSLLYFSTGQKEAAYDCIREIKIDFFKEEDYPLFSNYYRIKAYYMSLYKKDTQRALEIFDSLLAYDAIHAKEDNRLINIDRLNKCEVLLNGKLTSQVKELIDTVSISLNQFPELEPQFYVNKARLFLVENELDSAYEYAKLVVNKTSKIYEDIDNNIYALEIILHYNHLNNNLPEYIKYRNIFESLKEERIGERMEYGMAFVNEKNYSEYLQLKSQNERKILLWIFISIFIVIIAIMFFFMQKHKEVLIKNEMVQLECDRLDSEAFKRKLENEILLYKINSKSDELSKATNEIIELSLLLNNKNDSSTNDRDTYLDRLMEVINKDYPDFQSNLKIKFPDITKTELLLACLIKLNLTSEEIASAMSISKPGLVKARYRLRKKLGILSSKDLDSFIIQI